MRRLREAALVTALLFTAGCGGDDHASGGGSSSARSSERSEIGKRYDKLAKEAAARKAEASAEATPTETHRFQVGATVRYVGGGSIALLKVNNPAGGELGDTPQPGRKFVSLLLKQCAAPEGDVSTFVGEWFFIDRSGGEHSSVRTLHGWPSPEFPQFVDLQPGQCKKGWMALELKDGPKFAEVVYRLSGTGETVAQWEL